MVKGIGVPVFRLPFNEAAAFWKDKVTVPADYFYSLEQSVRARAFTVSNIATQNELSEVFQGLTRALNDGVPFSDFKGQVKDIFKNAGLSTSRMDLVFRNNLQASYHAGRWGQQQGTKEDFPFLEYDAINDSRTRPAHAEMDGFTARSDDPVWETWYPPNGHRCRCGVTSRTADQVKRKHAEIQTAAPDGLKPDKGWAYNPGTAPFRGLVLNGLDPGWKIANERQIRTADVVPIDGKPADSMDAAVNAFRDLFGADDVAIHGVIMSMKVLESQKSAWQWGHLIKDVLERPSTVDALAYSHKSGRYRMGRRYSRKLATGGSLEAETMLGIVRKIMKRG